MNKQTNDQAANEFVQTVSDQGSGGAGPSWRTVQGLLTAIGYGRLAGQAAARLLP